MRLPRPLVFSALVFAFLPSVFAWASAFPEARIASGSLKANLYLPDADNGYYRATRFDWSGVVSSLEFAGHNYFGVWFPRYDPKLHDSITGPVEEFRTGESGLGYDEAKAGGTFIRIGVGVLRKPDESKFQQFKTYDIVDPGKWTINPSADAVEFIQTVSDKSSGYAYLYKKTVHLAKDRPRMTIDHSLKNSGKKAIETNVYSHNFYVIDDRPSGPDFTVKFAFDAKATLDLKGLAQVQDKELTYLKPVAGGGQSVFTQIEGFGNTSKDFDIRVENKTAKAGVRQTGDRPLSKIVFWSIQTVLSPEPYIEMKIEPGKESKWRLTYDFYTLP